MDDLIGLALIGERPVGDGQGEVLGDLVLVDDLAGALADLPGVSGVQSPAGTLDAGLDLGEFDLGRGQQFGAFAGALGRDGRVAADHEALAGEQG